VATAVEEVDHVTQSNAASAEETASAASELQAQSEALRHAIDELDSIVTGSTHMGNDSSHNLKIRQKSLSPA